MPFFPDGRYGKHKETKKQYLDYSRNIYTLVCIYSNMILIWVWKDLYELNAITRQTNLKHLTHYYTSTSFPVTRLIKLNQFTRSEISHEHIRKRITMIYPISNAFVHQIDQPTNASNFSWFVEPNKQPIHSCSWPPRHVCKSSSRR